MSKRDKIDLAGSGEAVAKQFVTRLGYQIVRQNYSSPYGELDIIAREGDEIVIIEVKTRCSHNLKDAENSISKSKQRKITLTAQHFLAQYPEFAGFNCRFDAIIIFYFEKDDTFQIKHIKNAFLPIYQYDL